MNSGFGAQFLDADNDGNRDLVVVNGHILDNIAIYHAGVTHAEVKKLYRNLGGGRFADVTAAQPESFRAPRVGRGLAVGDYDNDGFPDLLVGNNGEEGQLFRNSGAPGRHWLGVRLVGDEERARRHGRAAEAHGGPAGEPRPGQGRAQLLLRAGSRASCSAWERRRRWTSLEILWPSGERQVLRDLPADRYVTVEEGKGITAYRFPATARSR